MLGLNIAENTSAGGEGEPRLKQVVQTGENASPSTPIQAAANGFVVVKRRDVWSCVNIHTGGFFRSRRQLGKSWRQQTVGTNLPPEQRGITTGKKIPTSCQGVRIHIICNRGYKRGKKKPGMVSSA